MSVANFGRLWIDRLRMPLMWGAFGMLGAGMGSAAASLPLGQWRVEAVHVDGQRTSRMAIVANDPALVGQRLSSTADRLSLAGADGDSCEGPSAQGQPSSLARLIGDTMDARPEGAPAATPADYGLAVPDGGITVYWIACRAGHFGPSDFRGHPGAWLVQTGRTLLVGWADHTVLAAGPAGQAATGAPAGPSFDCARAGTATERAICRSPDLSAADRGVAAAYGSAQYWCDKDPGKLALLAKVQKAWRARRDACGGDAACLAKSMADQTAKLGDPSGFLGD
jgi:uncharacterized protein YecT (DUF1311 family)